MLGQSQDALLRKLTSRTGFVYLARALPARQAEAVLALKIPGVSGTPVMKRVYPRETLAAQVLGQVGTEGQGSRASSSRANACCTGDTGERRVVSDAIGQPVSISEPHAEEPGQSSS